MQSYSLPIQIFSGNIAGWAAISAGQPFDLLKTKYQLNQHVCLTSLRQLILKQGICILYRGASSIYLFSGLIFSIQFSTFQTVSYLFAKYNYLQSRQQHIKQLILTGGIVGAISSTIYTPTQYTKIISQISLQSKPQGSFKRIINMIKNQKINGIKKMYKGHIWTMLRDIPGMSLFYGGFHAGLYRLCENREEAKLGQQLIASSTAALAYAAFTYPVDTIKTNLQSKNIGFKEFYAKRFWKQASFLKGYKAALMRGLTMDTTALTVYENIRNFFYQKKCGKH